MIPTCDRTCNGGPPGPWCGKPATHVARDADGLEWFTCSTEHAYGATLTPIAEWFAQIEVAPPAQPVSPEARRLWEAAEAARRAKDGAA